MTGSATPADTLQEQNESTISQVLSSVVLIQTASDLGLWRRLRRQGGIVTNDHVVGNATTFTVTASGSTAQLPATLVGT
jgi:S1-C subfamily serine protease